MHAAGTAYTDQKYHFYRNGNKLTNDSDIPYTVYYFLALKKKETVKCLLSVGLP